MERESVIRLKVIGGNITDAKQYDNVLLKLCEYLSKCGFGEVLQMTRNTRLNIEPPRLYFIPCGYYNQNLVAERLFVNPLDEHVMEIGYRIPYIEEKFQAIKDFIPNFMDWVWENLHIQLQVVIAQEINCYRIVPGFGGEIERLTIWNEPALPFVFVLEDHVRGGYKLGEVFDNYHRRMDELISWKYRKNDNSDDEVDDTMN